MTNANPSRRASFLGSTLGGAIGDALGAPTEFMSMAGIRATYGERGIETLPEGGRYTDDTQLAEIVMVSTMTSVAAGESLDAAMKRLAQAFIGWARAPQGGHRAPGGACLAGCRALASGAEWSKAGGATAGGCGSVMRAWPMGLIFSNNPAKAETWAVAQSRLTHNDPIALAACAAIARGVAAIARGESTYRIGRIMISAAARYDKQTARMIRQAIRDARNEVSPEIVFDRLRAWAAHEAIAAAAYLFVKYPDDFRSAACEGANTPGDSDSIASIAGAMVGARVGIDQIPSDWVARVERSEDLQNIALRAAAV